MQAVVEEYWRQVPAAREGGCYLFLDEVQECDEWQGFCQRIAEQECVTLVITGSSSKVSSSEIATQFRGRSHVHEMWPLSFAEYCTFGGVALPQAGQDSFAPREQTKYESMFDEYLQWGGFPGIQGKLPSDRIEILQRVCTRWWLATLQKEADAVIFRLLCSLRCSRFAIPLVRCPQTICQEAWLDIGQARIGKKCRHYSSFSSRHTSSIICLSTPPCFVRIPLLFPRFTQKIMGLRTRFHALISRTTGNDWKHWSISNCADV